MKSKSIMLCTFPEKKSSKTLQLVEKRLKIKSLENGEVLL